MMTKEKLKAEIVDAITVKGEICVNDIVKICRRNHARWRGTQRIAVTGYPNAILLVDVSDMICEAIHTRNICRGRPRLSLNIILPD